MDATIVAEIDQKLERVISDESVTIPWAIESGSRAWGFPSPDSDYDCRFVYIRSLSQTLSLFPKRDVIELPLTPIFDVNGWELAKALKLLLKGNAVIIEWLTSPIIYRGDAEFQKQFLQLAHEVVNRGAIANHYLRLAISGRDRQIYGDEIPLKKLFYILRPLLALDWLRAHDNKSIAPMHFPTLLAQADLSENTRRCIHELIEAKSVTNELGSGNIPAPISTYMRCAFERAESNPIEISLANSEQITLAEEFHMRWLTGNNQLY
ncbi:MAG: nucleotidyltransferase domain-containing protein [Rhizobiaceae bacterium]